MNIWIWAALGAVLTGVLVMAWMREQRRNDAEVARKQKLQALDTVQAWEPHGTRILSNDEREAYAILVKALPEYMVLAQVPLSRFLKVPTRYSYAEWLKRVGSLSADLVVCDRSSAVVAVVEVRSARESERSRQRHERMARVLEAAHIRMLVWHGGDLPSPAAVRGMLLPEEAEEWAETRSAAMSRQFNPALSALPVADVDDSGPGGLHEPPPSTWFDDFEQQPTASTPPRRH
ncbi:MAG: DUF2726 domain-containing protein [Pseudomonadota bacterium]